ncbi:hypothetical protein MPSEU_000005500 [Mayamaea pseudoterrestris]|nr:hypothetical protein MPSEU_000005500 [Mayamaea pseudoterrestris]
MTETTPMNETTGAADADMNAMPIDDLLEAIRQKRETLQVLKSDMEHGGGEPIKEQQQQPDFEEQTTHCIATESPMEDNAAISSSDCNHTNESKIVGQEQEDDDDEEEEEEVIEEVSVCTADLGPEDDLSYQEVWEEEIIEDDDEDEPFLYEDVGSAALRPVVVEGMALQEAQAVDANDITEDFYDEEEVTESQAEDAMDPVVIKESMPVHEEPSVSKTKETPSSVPIVTVSEAPAPTPPVVAAIPAPLIAVPTMVTVTPPAEDVAMAQHAPIIEKRKERYNKLGNRLKNIWKPPNALVSTGALSDEPNAASVDPAIDDDNADTVATDNETNEQPEIAAPSQPVPTTPAETPQKKVPSRRQKSFSKMLGIRGQHEAKEAKESAAETEAPVSLTDDNPRPKVAPPKRQKSLSKLLGGGRQKSLTKQDAMTAVVKSDEKVKPAPRRQKSFSKMLSNLRQTSDPDKKKVRKLVAVRQVSNKSDMEAGVITEQTVTTTEEQATLPTVSHTERAPEEEKITVKSSTRIVDGKAVTTTTKTTWRVPRQGSDKQDESDSTSVTQVSTGSPVSVTPAKARVFSGYVPNSPMTPTRATPNRVAGHIPPPSPSSDIGWSKPEWTKPVLRKTKMGDAIRAGEK